MGKFSDQSEAKLATCDARLHTLFLAVVEHFDCTVLEGHRDQAAQDADFAAGKSKLQYPNGRHNALPSLAADVAPYPIDFNDTERLVHFAGFVRGMAASLNIPLRWGGDWNGDTELKDNTFNDLVHFEIPKV